MEGIEAFPLDNQYLRDQNTGEAKRGGGQKMAFVTFTRPDDTPVAINSKEVLHVAPVPPSDAATGGPLDQGTRIVFKTGGHQDVKELVDEVTRKLNEA